MTRLLENLDGSAPDDDVERAWQQEVGRRIQDLVTGKAKTIPASQAIGEVRSRLGKQP